MAETAIAAKKTTGDLAERYLTFTLGENTYGVELLSVVDIITMIAITKVPNVPDYVKGIINLRGKVIPVVDMRLKFGLEPIGYDERTCIIVVNVDRVQVGLIVDRVSEVQSFDAESLSLIPEFSQYNDNKYLSSVGRAGEKLVLNIDLWKIFMEDV